MLEVKKEISQAELEEGICTLCIIMYMFILHVGILTQKGYSHKITKIEIELDEVTTMSQQLAANEAQSISE